MFMVLLVLHDTDCLDDVLKAWDAVGVSGVTILPSTGLARMLQKSALRDDLPLIPSMENITEHTEETNRTLFSIVADEQMADRVITATEEVIGDLDGPNTGIIAVLPVTRVKGLFRKSQ